MFRSARLSLPVLATVLAVSSCSSGGDDAAPGDSTQARPSYDVGEQSEATPLDDETIAAAEDEGTVVLYTNANDTQLQPLVAGFTAAYPGIAVQALSLDASEVFQRYLSESASGGRTADVIINSDGLAWRDFVDRGAVADYSDPNVANLPDYAQLLPGVVAMSEDPLIAAYNAAIIPPDQQPTSLADLAERAGELPGRLGTYSIEHSLGYAGTFEFLQRSGEEGWEVLEELASRTTPEDSAGTMITKLTQGEYPALFFTSGAARAVIDGQYADLLDYAYLTDATPLLPRGIAVTEGAEAPHAARVFMNYVLSVEGQQAACEGGFTPYRAGVDCPYGLPAIAAEIGEENVVPGSYSDDLESERDEVVARWNEAFGR